MVDAARRAPTVQAAATRRHWRELYVAAPAGHNGVLEGYVDLVVEEPGGLVVVDYKTDRTVGPDGTAHAANRYLPQVASYATALEVATGITVCRCVLVFVGDGEPVEVEFQGDPLAAARARAVATASELVSTP
jgi:ATP-dependent helicase/nuclease subunit A